MENAPTTPQSNMRPQASDAQVKIATTLALSAASSFNKAMPGENSSSPSGQGGNYIILATEESAVFAKELTDSMKSISPNVITVVLPQTGGDNAKSKQPPVLGQYHSYTSKEPKSDVATEAGGMMPTLLSSPTTQISESPPLSPGRQDNSPPSPLPLPQLLDQEVSPGSPLKSDVMETGETGGASDTKQLLDNGNEGGVSKEIGVVNGEEDVDKDMSNHPRGRKSIAHETDGEEVTQQPSNKSTRTVKFNRTLTKTASVGTTDSGAASTRRSENFMLSRWLSRRSSRMRPVISRTRSRFPTLHIVPQKDKDATQQQTPRNQRGRITVDALPPRTVVNEDGEEVDEVEERMSRPRIATRSDSTNERGAKYDRRGRSLFRGIGSNFSSSANRRRGRTPSSRGTQGASRFRWFRMTSPSPAPPRTDSYASNVDEDQVSEANGQGNAPPGESVVARKLRLYRERKKKERGRDTVPTAES